MRERVTKSRPPAAPGPGASAERARRSSFSENSRHADFIAGVARPLSRCCRRSSRFARLSPATRRRLVRKGGAVVLGVLGVRCCWLRGSFAARRARRRRASLGFASAGQGRSFAVASSRRRLRDAARAGHDGAFGDDRDAARPGHRSGEPASVLAGALAGTRARFADAAECLRALRGLPARRSGRGAPTGDVSRPPVCRLA